MAAMMASTAATTAALGCVASGQEVGRVRDLILGTFSLVWISVFFFFFLFLRVGFSLGGFFNFFWGLLMLLF
jgi:hypothetical protein